MNYVIETYGLTHDKTGKKNRLVRPKEDYHETSFNQINIV